MKTIEQWQESRGVPEEQRYSGNNPPSKSEETEQSDDKKTQTDDKSAADRLSDVKSSLQRLIDIRDQNGGSMNQTNDKEVEPVKPETVQTPEPTAQEEAKEYVESVSARAERLKGEYEKDLENKRAEIQTEIEQTKNRITEIKEEKDETMENVESLVSPFREDLEKKERQRLNIEENFRKNQKLINELDGLLTESTQLVEKLENQRIPGLAGIQQSARAQNKLNDVNARVGIIESVISARRNQMADAERLIDRTREAITADRKDQLSYYDTLLNMQDKEATNEREKLISLDKEDKAFMEEQMNIVKSELERAQETSDYIKSLMTEPGNAQLIADSGVKLTDSVEEINQKFAKYARQQEKIQMNNEMEKEGYEYLPLAEQYENKPENELRRLTDSQGNERVYWKPIDETETGTEDEAEELYQVGDKTITKESANIIEGVYSLSDLPEGTAEERSKRLMVLEDLNRLGFNSETPPEWYVNAKKQEVSGQASTPQSATGQLLGASPLDNIPQQGVEEIIQNDWEEYRKEVLGRAEDEEEKEKKEDEIVTDPEEGLPGLSPKEADELKSGAETLKKRGFKKDDAREMIVKRALMGVGYTEAQAEDKGFDDLPGNLQNSVKRVINEQYPEDDWKWEESRINPKNWGFGGEEQKETTINLNELDQE